MKAYDLINALGELEEETVLSAREERVKSVPTHRRVSAGLLIAATLVLILSIGAAAYAIAHANTVRLMEAGPLSGGQTAVEIDARAVEMIETQSVDYDLSVTDKGTTVTLNSLMGCSAETSSQLYLTLTVTPPTGTVFPEDVTEHGFVDVHCSFPFDAAEASWEIPQRGFSCTAVKNEDGTVSVMLLLEFGGPVENAPLLLTLENFDLTGKAAAEAELERQHREKITGVPEEAPAPLLEGVWEFDLGGIRLPEQPTITLEKPVLEAAGLPLNTLELNPFGGQAAMDNTAPSDLDRLREAYPEELHELLPEVDWDALTEAEFEALRERGMASVEEDAYLRLCDMLAWLEPWDYDVPTELTLEYPDGGSYTVTAPSSIWGSIYETELEIEFRFPAPQPIDQASAIVINGVRIPLR